MFPKFSHRFYSIVASNLLRPNSEYHVSVNNLNIADTVRFRITLNNTDTGVPVASEDVNLGPGESRLIPFSVSGTAQRCAHASRWVYIVHCYVSRLVIFLSPSTA